MAVYDTKYKSIGQMLIGFNARKSAVEQSYYLRQKKRIALEESWFIVARSVQIHSLDVPDVPSIL